MITTAEYLSLSQNGNPLVSDVQNTRKHKNKSTVYYVPLRVKTNEGLKPFTLKFTNQILASQARLPPGTTKNDAKFLSIAFRESTDESLSEYKKANELKRANSEFINCLRTIEENYRQLAQEIIHKGDNEHIKVTDEDIFTFVQTSVADQTGCGSTVLDRPIYRMRLPSVDGKIGYSYSDQFKNIVFDVKTNKPATVSKKPLSLANAHEFITRGSLASGVISFESIVISKKGISIRCQLRTLYVLHKKPTNSNEFDASDLNDFLDTESDEILVKRSRVAPSGIVRKRNVINSLYNDDDESVYESESD